MVTSHELVSALGPHASRAEGLDLETDEGLWAWLVIACLLAAPAAPSERALAAFRALGREADVSPLAATDPVRLALRLEQAGLPQAERRALTLVRAARALGEHHAGSLTVLLRDAGDARAAGEALVALAPGLGAATALRFLRPLREQLAGASELPISTGALAAATCLEWLPPEPDPETAAESLWRRLAEEPEPAPARDVEAALERLGSAACARRGSRRCPLAAACPLRYRQEP